jgi:hypothetical protein
VRFQVLTAASMKFRTVFWDILPCKMIVDRRLRSTCCLHHQGINFILTRSYDKNKFVYFNYISYLFEALEPHLMELDLSELKLNFNQFNLTQFNRIY